MRVPFRRSLRPLEEGQYGELLSLLSNVFLCRDFKNLFFFCLVGVGSSPSGGLLLVSN